MKVTCTDFSRVSLRVRNLVPGILVLDYNIELPMFAGHDPTMTVTIRARRARYANGRLKPRNSKSVDLCRAAAEVVRDMTSEWPYRLRFIFE